MSLSLLDAVVLFGTLLSIVAYGVWKTRGSRNIESFLRGDNSMPWWVVGLSIMATQASAITFLSTPGQAYADGMRFVQFYFGLPIAMVIISATMIPIYYRLKVYTAYEYLESRFDLRTRTFTAFLFLIQRGLAAGLTIYAPAIVLSSILGWPLTWTNLLIGVLVIIYTVSGGTKAVSQTQKQQMAVMMGGMLVAGLMVLAMLPEGMGLGEAVSVAGSMGRLNVVDFSFDIENRYNFWSGITGGLFLALSYFGTDQSQVARYLSGKSISEIRLGLMFNGLLKIPMQFVILFIGVLVFVFYQFQAPPLLFNRTAAEAVISNPAYAGQLQALETAHQRTNAEKKAALETMLQAQAEGDATAAAAAEAKSRFLLRKQQWIQGEAQELVKTAAPDIKTQERDFIFITYVLDFLPPGLIGLLLAVIFSAAMSSTSSELNALASTTTVDIYRRSIVRNGSDGHYLLASRALTVLWGLLAILFATFASELENLIQAVNILGSIFYGTVLGIFLVAFYIKYIKAAAVFPAAVLAQVIIILIYFYSNLEIGYLWFNVMGCGMVILFGLLFQALIPGRTQAS